ncbi:MULTISPECIES: hypothetical protein [unclassified Undibacterium]|uniref:helix-turn-helix transcriptional regulator n=2 Tax=Undibacterium TaxID=401469 RepID=UPI002AC8F215|nr:MULTISPECIES: hypothetical protein [unclassified Undibacterium]MEB0137700.1 hypothetical protein [Undibacterium sp. CCC2.1]MEB0172648.1 hypothetical protein [Undibacterium sp. CCC1.1]MEB0178213.1 hypothetical protein [Undibacterium sp. CCC3.4]MEB0215443.1 hypothetical protein [Undibacterium sp. 5I2]WPX42274.1 hypothetical protein RHM61_12815 [Undibacterium sp. CCC3.4]
MMYRLVSQKNFTVEQTDYIEKLKESIQFISNQSDMIVGIKDVDSKHFISSDSYANLVGLANGADVKNRMDHDMPCEATARFADSYVKSDRRLLHYANMNHKIRTLDIFEHVDGIKALVFNKHMIKHHPSESILGLMYDAYEIDIKIIYSLIPNYAIEFERGFCIENADDTFQVGNVKLTEYEREICFLLIMNWNFKQIACFMDKHRPKSSIRTADTIYKCRNRICEKLHISNCSASQFKNLLVGAGLHKKMPKLFFHRLIGSRVLT